MSINLKLLSCCLVFGLLALALGVFSRDTHGRIETLFDGDYVRAQGAIAELQEARRTATLTEARFAAIAEVEAELDAEDRMVLSGALEGMLADVRAAYEAAASAATREPTDLILYTLRSLQGTKGEITRRAVRAQLGKLDAPIAGALAAFSDEAGTTAARFQREVDVAAWSVLAGLACCFFGFAATVFWISRRLVGPVRQATAVVDAMARGDLTASALPVGGGEFAALRKAIGNLRTSIQAQSEAQRRSILAQASSLGSTIEAKQNQFLAAMNNMTQGLCMLDAELRLVVFNEPFAAMFGEFQIGTSAREVLADPRFHHLLEPHETGVFVHHMPDGAILQVKRRGLRGGGLVVTFDNVTEQHRISQRLEHLAGHDVLTGLANRRRFQETLQSVLVERPNGDVAIFCLDLSSFKSINDMFGHPVGDDLLKAVAGRLTGCIGPRDLAARLGGDEFAIIQQAGAQPAAAEALAGLLLRAFEPPFNVGGRVVPVGISMGIVTKRQQAIGPARSLETAMQNCDLALQEAKRRPGSAYRFYVPEMRETLRGRRELEADLRQALDRGEFGLAYQPFVDADTRCISGFEALLRWHHPVRGPVSPSLFIPIAEELGLIDEIGLWALRNACAQAASWPRGLTLSVNLSPVQFRRRTLVADIARTLADAGLAASQLQLEVTESLFLDPAHDILPMLNGLRQLGTRIAMDDFGTGYSSLGYLARFPFDKIKIDQSFVREIDKPESKAVVRAILGLSRALNIGVMAEGIETVEQYRMLHEDGCREMQGYLFSRPRPASDLPSLLMNLPLNWEQMAGRALPHAQQA